jgi:predicted NBD/HSP70 family sugar kinase
MGGVELLEREGNHHPSLLVVERGAGAYPCRCGLTGCLETIASGWGVTTGGADRAARGSVQAMLNLAAHYHPQAICIGGGLLEHEPEFRFRITELYAAKAREREWLPRLTDARRGDNAGVLGAAQAALSLA